jgi:hypothetical protein
MLSNEYGWVALKSDAPEPQRARYILAALTRQCTNRAELAQRSGRRTARWRTVAAGDMSCVLRLIEEHAIDCDAGLTFVKGKACKSCRYVARMRQMLERAVPLDQAWSALGLLVSCEVTVKLGAWRELEATKPDLADVLGFGNAHRVGSEGSEEELIWSFSKNDHRALDRFFRALERLHGPALWPEAFIRIGGPGRRGRGSR